MKLPARKHGSAEQIFCGTDLLSPSDSIYCIAQNELNAMHQIIFSGELKCLMRKLKKLEKDVCEAWMEEYYPAEGMYAHSIKTI